MSSSLHEVWEAAAASPFEPFISKDGQFFVGFSLLSFALSLSAVFALNRSAINLPLIGLPASVAFGFGAVYMICAVQGDMANPAPIFSATSSSARQLFTLLRCVNFGSRAQIQISKDGLRVSVDEARVMQGIAFLDKALFTTYHYEEAQVVATRSPPPESEIDSPTFHINLSALMETLQIFGFSDGKDRWSSRDSFTAGINGMSSMSAAFDNRILGVSGICKLVYEDEGAPLSVTMEEGNLTTTCELVTYEPDTFEDIPFNRERLSVKIIMKASWLYDAVAELSNLSPERVSVLASPHKPYFSLAGSGPLGEVSVDFNKDPQLLETFQVHRKTVNTYKFSLLKGAAKAMGTASKVSIRGDDQGVLSLQFMVETESGGVSFIDFRFVPYIADEDEEEAQSQESGIDDMASNFANDH